MIRQNQEQIRNKTTCDLHKGNPVIGIRVGQSSFGQVKVCSKCLIGGSVSYSEIEFIEDISNCTEETVFSNWPPITQEYPTLLAELEHILYSQTGDEKFPEECIVAFLEKMKDRIDSKIKSLIKDILRKREELYISKEQLKKIYNQISQKNKFKEFTTNQNETSTIQEFIQQMGNYAEENSKNLRKSLDLYYQTQSMLNLQIPYKIESIILSQIDSLSQYIQRGEEHSPSEMMKDLRESSKVRSITQLITNRFNFCDDEFIEKVQKAMFLASPMIDLVFTENQLIPSPNNYIQKLKDNQVSRIQQLILNLASLNCTDLEEIEERLISNKTLQQLRRVTDSLRILEEETHTQVNQLQWDKLGSISLTHSCTLIPYFDNRIQEGSFENCTILKKEDGIHVDILSKRNASNFLFTFKETLRQEGKYIIRFEVEPFLLDVYSYKLCFGVGEDFSQFHSQIRQDSLLLRGFSNDLPSVFESIKRGYAFSDPKIKVEQRMRILEVQIDLKSKHILVADFPYYSNITIIDPNLMPSSDENKAYKFFILTQQIRRIHLMSIMTVREFRKF